MGLSIPSNQTTFSTGFSGISEGEKGSDVFYFSLIDTDVLLPGNASGQSTAPNSSSSLTDPTTSHSLTYSSSLISSKAEPAALVKNSIYSITFPNNHTNPQQDGTLPITPTLQLTIPDATLLNGLTHFRDNIFLVADSYGGFIWRVDLTTKSKEVIFHNDFTISSFNQSTGQTTGGVNGLKIRNGWLYFSSTAAKILARIPLDRDGYVIGKENGIPEVLVSGVLIDDFWIDSLGRVFLTDAENNRVLLWSERERRYPGQEDGEVFNGRHAEKGQDDSICVVVSNVPGPTALVGGQNPFEDVLYVSYTGGDELYSIPGAAKPAGGVGRIHLGCI